MNKEKAAILNPSIRAERLVTGWHAAVISQIAAIKARDPSLINAANSDLRTAARAIADDPPAVAMIRSRVAELGVREGSSLGVALKSPDAGQALLAGIDAPARGLSR
jgi:hypothetical protein